MTDRKAEMELKRQKLESMRQSRSEKAKAVSQSDPAANDNLSAGKSDNKMEADRILQQLGISDLPHSNSTLEACVPNSMQSSTFSGVGAFMTPSQSLVLPSNSESGSTSKRKPMLAISPVTTTVIQPKESITYSKEVQTLPTTPTSNEVGDGRQGKGQFDYYAGSRINSPRFFSNFEWDDEFTHMPSLISSSDKKARLRNGSNAKAPARKILAYDGEEDDIPTHQHHSSKFASSPDYEMAPSLGQQNGSGSSGAVSRHDSDACSRPANPAPPASVRELTDEERQQIVDSDRFQNFVSRASRVLERALTQPDVCVDYTRDMTFGKTASLSSEVFNLATTFTDDRHGSRHRLVTAVDFSPINPELVLASYCDHGDSAIADPQGLVLIWNNKFSGAAPEFVFHAESPVRAACFAPFHPNLVVGATYSGQVVLWDTRLPRRTPANRTPLSSTAHTHPIYCLKVVGTQNANNLISISTDGRLCSWTLDMFSQPQETLDLSYKQKPVNAVCCAFLDNDPNNFVVGGEDGAMYTACRHGNKQGVLDQFDAGHQFNVTAIDTHRARGPIDFSNLVLSASNDWAVRLWSTRSTKMYIEQFREGQDSSTDVKWSPVHPALFASSDASGRLNLYDLNANCEVPVASVAVESGRALIKRVSWHPSGQLLAAGTESGVLHLYSVNEATALPRPDDWQLFSTSVRMMLASAEDRVHATPIGQMVPASLLTSLPASLAAGVTGTPSLAASPAVSSTAGVGGSLTGGGGSSGNVLPPHILLAQSSPATVASHF